MAGDALHAGIVVRDAFISPVRVRELIDCATRRRARGEFRAAAISTAHGGTRGGGRRADVRGDFTCWLGTPLLSAEQHLLRDFEQLRLDLNREAFLGLFDLELHYAWYPPGAGYARHLDQPRGQEQRQVSVILYLNREWTSESGGTLRLFDDPNQHRDIEPIAGRLVYFLSARHEHAVLPTQSDRLSISGWFRRRPDVS